MNVTEFFSRVLAWMGRWPVHTKALLSLALTMVLVELVLRRFAPGSAAYARWTGFLQRVGAVWTAVILSLVYFVSVAVVSAFMRLFRKDPLDRKLGNQTSFWHAHEPNPLGPQAAARHQF